MSSESATSLKAKLQLKYVESLMSSTVGDLRLNLSILKKYPDLALIKNLEGKTTLHMAALRGDLKLMSKLVELGVNVNAQDNSGNTALHDALTSNDTESIMELLMDLGADISIQDQEGSTPLHYDPECINMRLFLSVVQANPHILDIKNNKSHNILQAAFNSNLPADDIQDTLSKLFCNLLPYCPVLDLTDISFGDILFKDLLELIATSTQLQKLVLTNIDILSDGDEGDSEDEAEFADDNEYAAVPLNNEQIKLILNALEANSREIQCIGLPDLHEENVSAAGVLDEAIYSSDEEAADSSKKRKSTEDAASQRQKFCINEELDMLFETNASLDELMGDFLRDPDSDINFGSL